MYNSQMFTCKLGWDCVCRFGSSLLSVYLLEVVRAAEVVANCWGNGLVR